jgi:hypothetical protein
LRVLNHRLALTGQTVRVLQDLSRLGRRTLSLCLRWRLALLLRAGFVGLRPLSLQDGGLLGRLRPDGLIRELCTSLLLLLSDRLLLLLRPLQNLRRKLSWHTSSRHTGILRLLLREMLLRVLLLLRISWEARRWRMLDWRSAYGLSTHHGLDLLHAHGLPRGRGLLRSGGGLG